MKLFFAVILTVFAVVLSESEHKYEEPVYTLAKNQPKDKSFEVRIYKPSTWTATTYAEGKWAQSKAFMSLFHYIQGKNKQGTVMPMTVPVLTTFSQPECLFCEKVFGMSFYLPKKYQAKPPVPINTNLTTISYPTTVMYTSSFPGYANEATFKWHARRLYRNLKRNGITDKMIKMKMFLGASYDSPMHFHDRHNEVWIEGISKKLRFY